jgi:hypothetical protein
MQTSLSALQEIFANALADPGQSAQAVTHLAGPPERAEARLAVYRHNVMGNLRGALANAYPITQKIVGAEFFNGLGDAYLARYPSLSGDLNEYGAHLADFVAEFPDTQDLPYLPDVARMEWLAHRAHYARDALPFDLSRLSSIAESACPTLRVVLAPACALYASRWPLARIWEVHQDDYAGEFAVDLEAGPAQILIHRPRFRVQVASLAPGAYAFLERVLVGESIAPALEAALAVENAFELPAALREWVEAGVVVSIES